MPRYVIHVGPMKTGSTYLQKCLTGAAGDLLAQGVCYPTELLALNNKHMHMPVFTAARKRREQDVRPVFERLNAAGYETILLSCEHFIKLTRKQLIWLRDMIGAPDIEIVYACRRWSDRIPSMWFQSLFTGEADTLPEFYVKLLNGQANNADVDYSLKWRMLANIFGREHVSLFPYSTIMDRGEDIFTRFCTDILHLKTVPQPPSFGAKLWASFSTQDTELLRVLNGIYIAAHGARDARMYWQLNRRRGSIEAATITEAMGAHLTTMQLADTATHFDSAFSRMQEFADRVIGGDAVFERKDAQEPYVAPGYLLHKGVTSQLRAIYDKFSAAEAPPEAAEEDVEEAEV
jgi:hypothetical protein